jgi:hypothetical protein
MRYKSMPNIKLLSSILQKLLPMLKFDANQQTNQKTGQKQYVPQIIRAQQYTANITCANHDVMAVSFTLIFENRSGKTGLNACAQFRPRLACVVRTS